MKAKTSVTEPKINVEKLTSEQRMLLVQNLFNEEGKSIDEIVTMTGIMRSYVGAYIEGDLTPKNEQFALPAYTITVEKISNFRDKVEVGDLFRVRKKSAVAELGYSWVTAEVTAKYPHVVNTTAGTFAYVDLYSYKKLGHIDHSLDKEAEAV